MQGIMGFNAGHLAAITPNGFNFSVNSNGQVTGMERVLGTHTFDLRLPANATFAVAGTKVTETLTGSAGTQTLTYAQDPTQTGLYHLSADAVTISNPTTTSANGWINGYSFTIAGGKVTAMQHEWGDASHTHTSAVSFLPTSSFSVSGTTVTETIIRGNTVETLQFVATGSAGLYAVASDTKAFVQAGSATTVLSVDPYDRAKFTADSSGKVTQVQDVLWNGTLVTVTPTSAMSFSQLAPGYVLETVTNGSRSSYEVYRDGNGDGIYTGIAHGAGTTIDLVGLQTQVSPTIDALL